MESIEGKRFSILGDSISTLEGYNPGGYNVFFDAENGRKAGVEAYGDTWWGRVIDFFGGELLVNNSWSGSRVTKLPGRDGLFPSGCSGERTSSLHINSVKPDLIIVYLGFNDWAYGARTGEENGSPGDDGNEFFNFAYRRMLMNLRQNYPESRIWCCTLGETFMSGKPEFRFPHLYAGTHIEKYNDIIRREVAGQQCNLIDLYRMRTPYDTIDGSHPNHSGMRTLAELIIRGMTGKVL